MERPLVLDAVLRHVISSEPELAIELCASRLAVSFDGYVLALQAFGQFMNREYSLSAGTAQRAVAEAADPEARALALAVSGLAAAGCSPPTAATTAAVTDPLATALGELHTVDATPEPSRTFTFYMLTEAALACARLDLAASFAARWGELPSEFFVTDGLQHPYVAVILASRLRLLAFRGQISEAIALAGLDLDYEQSPLGRLVIESTQCLIRGNAAETSVVRSLADRLEKTRPESTDYISSGCYLLVSYGLIATGDTTRAARCVLIAGDTAQRDGLEGLAGLTIIDRALGLEMLVAAAIADNDLTAASAWCAQAMPLLESPISQPTVERTISRVELFAGEAEAAAEWATQALSHFETGGRAIERAETELTLTRAHLALSQRSEASARLEAMAQGAALTGHLAARRAAMRALRSMGRRLRPAPGSGLSGLSERETDVALLVSEGYTNSQIASELHLSAHTVHVHVSRALAAFGVASRFALAAQLAELLPSRASDSEKHSRAVRNRSIDGRAEEGGRAGEGGRAEAPPSLTPRQETVVEHIVLGHSNQLIAKELGLSIKTIEKHVGEVFLRWGVDSRIAVAKIARSRTFPMQPISAQTIPAESSAEKPNVAS